MGFVGLLCYGLASLAAIPYDSCSSFLCVPGVFMPTLFAALPWMPLIEKINGDVWEIYSPFFFAGITYFAVFAIIGTVVVRASKQHPIDVSIPRN